MDEKLKIKIEQILLKYGSDVVDFYQQKNDKTVGELLEVPTAEIKALIDMAVEGEL